MKWIKCHFQIIKSLKNRYDFIYMIYIQIKCHKKGIIVENLCSKGCDKHNQYIAVLLKAHLNLGVKSRMRGLVVESAVSRMTFYDVGRVNTWWANMYVMKSLLFLFPLCCAFWAVPRKKKEEEYAMDPSKWMAF